MPTSGQGDETLKRLSDASTGWRLHGPLLEHSPISRWPGAFFSGGLWLYAVPALKRGLCDLCDLSSFQLRTLVTSYSLRCITLANLFIVSRAVSSCAVCLACCFARFCCSRCPPRCRGRSLPSPYLGRSGLDDWGLQDSFRLLAVEALSMCEVVVMGAWG